MGESGIQKRTSDTGSLLVTTVPHRRENDEAGLEGVFENSEKSVGSDETSEVAAGGVAG